MSLTTWIKDGVQWYDMIWNGINSVAGIDLSWWPKCTPHI